MALHPNLAAIDAALAAASSPLIRDFLTHMRAIHPGDRLPARAAFDPMAIAHLLGHLVLVQVERQSDGGMRFFVRVAGEVVLSAAPVPLMNRYIESSVNLGKVSDDSQPRIIDVRRQVAETGLTQHWRGRLNIPFRFNFADVEYAHCPLAEDGVTVDRILSAFYYHGAPDA
ncbi:MAG: hypothetical protein OJJ21_03680 [Ferrovibrio sp.]|uniref:hypothetical protein n=1 Tax=Ferrovibrio sp. TaxID=1917215 RepID=UPI0026027863|nr:hypothetical protein [Ferrovibrio sp.]MCW0232679.1 hypothetical protein [Ferrovibrio sp.]